MKLIIIGAGPGGYETARLAAERGVDVTLIEAGQLGGICLNEGCIPTKAFCRSAEVLEEMKEAAAFGVTTGETAFDFSVVASRKNAVVDQLRSGVETLMNHPRITLVRGRASFVDSHTVRVTPSETSTQEGIHEGTGAGQDFSADYIIIATGSQPASLPIPGADLPGVVTSKELLETEEVPSRLCVIGGGVIGLEFASVFRSFGSEVTVLEYCPEILPRFDKDIAKRLRQSLSKRGINFSVGSQVLSIASDGTAEGAASPEASAGALTVTFSKKGKEDTVTADKVLMAVGRRPATGSLNLDSIGLEYSPKGIKVNEFMQTNQPNVYAIGDIVGGYMLAHAATMQGVKALNHIMGIEDNIDLSIMPAAVFTMPEAATVGLTEEDCKTAGIEFKETKAFFRANGKALCLGQTDGLCKILSDADGRILGCHIYGPHACDLVHEAAAFMTKGGSLADLRDMTHVHPSLSEIFRI